VQALDAAVDVVVAGHSDAPYVGTVDGKLVTQASSRGTSFAALDLVLDRDSGKVVSKRGQIVDAWADVFPGSTPDPRVQPILDEAAFEVAPLIDRVVGTTPQAITREQTPAGEAPLGDLIADSQRARGGTQLAFVNYGSIRADLDAGPVTWGE